MTRRTILLALLLVPLLGFAPAARAEPALEDAAGDVTIAPTGTAAPENPQTASADLVGLDVVELDNDWLFTLRVASLAQPGGTLNTYAITWTWMDTSYRVDILRSRIDPTATPLLRASLSSGMGEEFNELTPLEPSASDAEGTISVLVGKVYILSSEGHSPVPGSRLEELVVTSRGDFTFASQGASFVDRMPDADAGFLTYTKGGESNGHLVLETSEPVRVSNGGSTTFVFRAHLQNARESEDTVTLRVDELPEGWKASVRSPVRVPAQEETAVFVITTIPFAHEHGGFSNFTLRAQSTSMPGTVATVKFGVLHTPIPQPAGHHGELYLHAVPSDTGVFGTAFPGTLNTMNTLGTHDEDVELAAADQAQGEIAWRIPLGPQLNMGLDFDTNKTGTLTGSLMARTSGQGTLAGELWLTKGEQDVAKLADLAPVDLALDLQAATSFELVATPTPESDYVPHAPGQNVELRLVLTPEGAPCCNPQQPPALVVADFKLALPLNEYHDAPRDDEGIDSTLTLLTKGATQKLGRPGSTMTYQWTVTNAGPEADEYEAEVAGANANVAAYAPMGDFRLEPRETRTLTLAVTIPPTAAPDHILEAILVIRSKTDPSTLALGRTSTTVTLGNEAQADESDVLAKARDERKDTPGPGLGLLGTALGMALAVARRGSGSR